MLPECCSENPACNWADTSKPIHDAARHGDAKLLQELLDKKMPYTEVDELGYTAMHMAAKVGSVECVTALLNAASKDKISQKKVLSKLYRRGRDGRTPHMLSVIFGHLDVFKTLAATSSTIIRLEAVKVAFRERRNEPIRYDGRRAQRMFFGDEVEEEYFEKLLLSYPIYLIACHGRFDYVELIRTLNGDGRRAVESTIPELHRAIERGCESSVRELLDENDVLIAKDREGNTALHKAAQFGNETIVRLVVDKIRDAYSTQEKGFSKCCCANIKKETPLLIASKIGKCGVFNIISELYTSDSIDEFGQLSLLHSACRRRDLNAVKLIVGKFPELLRKENDDRYYPLHICAQYGNMAMFKFLLKAGSSRDCLSTDTGYNVLHCAAFNGNPEILQTLLEEINLNLNTFGKRGDTPLHVAARVGNLAGVQMLLQHGADAAVVQKGWRCPIEEALSGGFLEVAKILSEVTPKVPNNGIFLRALRHRDSDLLRLVLEKGFTVHDYSTFWKQLLKGNEHDLSSKLELMFDHGFKFHATESIMETIVGRHHDEYIDVCHGTLDTLLRYGLMEMDAITRPNFSTKHCSTKSVMLPSNLVLYFDLLPPSVRCKSDSTTPIPRLLNLCRWATRYALAQSHRIVQPKDIRRLPLPRGLKRLLMFEETSPAKLRNYFLKKE